MVHLLNFSVHGIQGAVPLDDSIYLLRMVLLSPVQEGNGFISGMLNIHGDLIPVYSLRRMFGLPEIPPRLTDNLIVFHQRIARYALWVDETYVVREVEYSPEYSDISTLIRSDVPGIHVLTDGVLIIYDFPQFLEFCTSVDPLSPLIQILQNDQYYGDDLDVPDQDQPRQELVQQILAQRAEELIQAEGKTEPCLINILRFRLMYREYAIEMQYVREVVLSREITPVPGTPDHVIGICQVRGEIIPLVDLRVLLSVTERGLTDFNQVIVLTDGNITFGILADQITGIRTIPAYHIKAGGTGDSLGKHEYILGVDTQDLLVVNAAAILGDSSIIVDHSGEADHLPVESTDQFR